MEWPAVQPAVARRFAELCEYRMRVRGGLLAICGAGLELERERLSGEFTDVVAHQLFRMMAYKD